MKNRWNFKVLLLCHFIIALLVSSFLWPATRTYWDALDRSFFHWLNSSLADRPNWQLFWAYGNLRLADWIEDIVILSFFYVYIRSATKQMRLQRVSQFLFSLFLGAFIILFVNEILFRGQLRIPRHSPTLVVDHCIRLSQEIPWLHIKDSAAKSFPGDHATTAIYFGTIFTFFAGWRRGLPACLYAAYLCLPRMVAGAHWLSDVLVGSCSIVLFFLSWTLCSPFQTWVTTKIEKSLQLPKWRRS